MFKKEYRLTKDKDFANVFNKGKTFFTKVVGIRYVENNLDITRFGILVSVKISKKAVVRNKIKRRLREILCLHYDTIKPGYDIIILTHNDIKKCDYEELEENMEYAMKKTKLLKNQL